MTEVNQNACPCGSGDDYEACCGLYINTDVEAPDPLALMRSRYTAFTKNDFSYLKKTWHPETCPENLDDGEPNNWIGLEVLEWAMDDEEVEGEVEFKASLVFEDSLEILHELSSFEKIDGKWLYHSGEFKNENNRIQKLSMKEPCPCGSGTKFKHCHYKK